MRAQRLIILRTEMDFLALVDAKVLHSGMMLRLSAAIAPCLLLELQVLTFDELILHRKLVLLFHTPMRTEILDSILDALRFLETVWGRNLVIKAEWLTPENK